MNIEENTVTCAGGWLSPAGRLRAANAQGSAPGIDGNLLLGEYDRDGQGVGQDYKQAEPVRGFRAAVWSLST
jgi:hypothetical protein